MVTDVILIQMKIYTHTHALTHTHLKVSTYEMSYCVVCLLQLHAEHTLVFSHLHQKFAGQQNL